GVRDAHRDDPPARHRGRAPRAALGRGGRAARAHARRDRGRHDRRRFAARRRRLARPAPAARRCASRLDPARVRRRPARAGLHARAGCVDDPARRRAPRPRSGPAHRGDAPGPRRGRGAQGRRRRRSRGRCRDPGRCRAAREAGDARGARGARCPARARDPTGAGVSAGGRRGSSSHGDHGRGSPARRGGERAERSHGRATPRAENPREGAPRGGSRVENPREGTPRGGSRAESSPQGAARGSGRGKSARQGAPRSGPRAGGDQADRRKSFSRSAPSERRRTADPARLAAFDVLREVDGSDAYANLVLPPMLRARKIAGRDAAFATELAYGTLRLRGRYDAVLEQCSQRPLDEIDAAVLDILRLGCHQLLGMRVAPHAAVSETVGLARLRTGAGSGQFVNAVLRRVSERPLEEWLDLVAAAADPAGDAEEERLAVVASHPAWVVRALRGALVANGRDPAELGALLEADNTAPRVTLVARPGLAAADDVPERATPGAWAPTAFTIEGGDPGSLRSVREGRVGVQDEG